MPKIRVLVVDDSVVTRRLLSDVIAGDPDLEVVGAAATGRIALAKIPRDCPDLVILDIEMPEMNGLETLTEIRKIYPRLPVIIFSALTARGATVTLDALALGANDYVTKPQAGSIDEAVRRVRADLIPKIKVFCRGVLAPDKAPDRPELARASTRGSLVRPPLGIVAIGVSTGGPAALGNVLPLLPADFPVPIVIVQHMPPIFTRMLAERLAAKCAIRVREAEAGDRLVPGYAWIAPGDRHMVLARDRDAVQVILNQDPPENSCRPAADVLFRSVVQHFGARTLAVVLTGMGHDGLRGCERVREAGGQIIVQDEGTSVVWSMPGHVANAGLADEVLPVEDVAAAVLRRVQANRLASASATLERTASSSGR